MYPLSKSDIAKYVQFIENNFTTRKLRYLGNGKESVIYTDEIKVYKLIHDRNEEWKWVGLKLPGRFQRSKRFVNIEEFHMNSEYFVIIYSYDESLEYHGNRHTELIEFAIECYHFGVICRDLKFGNFRVFKDGIKLVDIGRDLVEFNFKDYMYMIQRMFLLINNPDNPRIREIIRNALKDWDLPELTGFKEFFNKIWLKLIDNNSSFISRYLNPINIYDKNATQQIFLSLITQSTPSSNTIFEIPNADNSFIENTDKIQKFQDLKSINTKISKNDSIVFNLIGKKAEDLNQLLIKFKQLELSELNYWIICHNPYYSRTIKNNSLRFYKKQLAYSGFKTKQIYPQPFNIVEENYFHSEYLLINVVPLELFSTSTITLLIKVCYQDHLFLESQINHIIKQCELPRELNEIIVVVDQKEANYLRQYYEPEKTKVIDTLSSLKKQKLIDDYILNPLDLKEIEKINYEWFGVKSQETHSIKNVPITPQLFGFEIASSDYVLQVDLDVLISRRDYYHDFIGDMITEIENDPYVLTVGMNIAKALESTFQPYSSNSPNTFVPEVRFCLFKKERLLENRPYPNEIIDGKLKLTWYRSIEQFQKDSEFKSLRGGDPRSFYVHPPNNYKTIPEVINEIQDRMEQNYVPKTQFLNVDLLGDLKNWQFPKRSEQVIFIICGRNISPARFERCWQSVINQKSNQWGAVIVDDASDNSLAEYICFTTGNYKSKTTLIFNRKRKKILYNIYKAIRNYCLNPYSIIVTLDADDFLISNFVVSHLIEQYNTGIQVTIGSTLRKQKGILPFVPNFSRPRNMQGGDVWMHLRSFRKYLFDRISYQDFLDDQGEWIDKFNELTFMIPIAEMTQSPKFINWPIYYYDPIHLRTSEHYQLNKQTLELMISKKKYEKQQFQSYPWIKPPGEIINLYSNSGQIILIRHGEKQKSTRKRNELTDEKNELTAYGKAMARKFGSMYPKKIDVIISSPLKRCIQTAEEFKNGNQCNTSISTNKVLAGFNRYSNIKWRDHKDLFGYGPALINWLKGKMEDEIIEKFEDYLHRLLIEIKSLYASHRGSTILVVTHDHVLICLIYYFYENINLRIPYLHGLIFDENDKEFQNKFLNKESFNLNTTSDL